MTKEDMPAKDTTRADGQLTREQFLGRTLATGAAAVAGGALLKAPGAAGAAPGLIRSQGQKSITMWSQGYGTQTFTAITKQITADFEKTSGIHVDWQIIPWPNAVQTWALTMSNGKTPDVADVFFLQARVLQGRGKWGPMDITAQAKAGVFGPWKRFTSSAQADAMYQGKIYGVPWRIDIRFFVYNSGLQPSVPKTLADFETTAKAAMAKNSALQYGSQTFGGPYHVLGLIGATFNVAILTPDFSASNLNDPRWVPALEWFQKSILEKVFNPAQITETTTFVPYAALAKQEIPSVWGGNLDIVGYAQGSAPQVLPHIHGALMPTNPASSVTKPRGIAATAQFAIFQNTKDLDSCTKWVAYLSSPAVAAKFATASSVLSADTVVQKILKPDAIHAAAYQQGLNCWSLDAPVPAWGQLTATTVGALNALAIAVASGKDVKASLATAHSATNAVIQAYKG